MWTVLVVLYLWVLRCAVSSSLPSPINVVFNSVNLKNVLHWSPGNGSPDDTLYTVKYAIYGDSKGKRVNWRAVRHCTKIVHTRCDLTSETGDLEQGYYAKVQAVRANWKSSDWTWTVSRFDPLSDTSFGPPLLSVEIEDRSAIITMKGPMRYQPNNHTPGVSMATFYPQMTYNLSIHNTHRDQTHRFLVDTSTYTYQMMDYDTTYCFSAKTRIPDMPIHCHSSERRCITSPKDPVIEHLLRVIVGIVVPSLCICAILVICYFLCNYLTGKGHKSPYVLYPPSFRSSPFTPDNAENPHILVFTIVPSSDKDPNSLDLPPLYFPPQPVEAVDDSAPDYGVVVSEVDVTRAEEDGNGPKGKCQRCEVGNSCEKKEERAEGGQSSHQVQPRLPVTSTPICSHAQEHAWSQLNSGLLTQGVFINKNSQTGHFNIPLNLQTNNDLEMGNGLEGKVTDAVLQKYENDADRGRNDEKVPLLSTYTFQSTMPLFDTVRSHFLADDNDTARPGADTDDEHYYEEEGAACIRPLVVPEMAVDFYQQGGSEGERGSGDMLRLENVFVRQSSEEAETLRLMRINGEPESDMDDFITRWKLVIPVDQ